METAGTQYQEAAVQCSAQTAPQQEIRLCGERLRCRVVRLGDLREKKETSSRKKVNAVVCFCIEIQWTTALIFDEQVLPCPTQRAKLDALLYNNPLEYAQLVLIGEIEHYLSLGCDHGRMED